MKLFTYGNIKPAAMTLAVLLASSLAACGGGGGNPNSIVAGVTPAPATPTPIPSTPTPSTDCKISLVADIAVAAGKTGGAAALSCGAPLGAISWTQVSGPSVALQAARTPTVAFETRDQGVIRLRADATLADGSAASATTDITVSAAPAGSFVTLRADHSVRPGTDTSVRAWPTLVGGESVASIVWTQTAGPTVKMTIEDRELLMFTAPASSTDVALRFRATMTTSTGKVDVDDIIISLDREAAKPTDYIFDTAARVHPYRQTGIYTSVLTRCTYDISLYYTDSRRNNLCSTLVLPPLQSEAGAGAVPTVAQVMGRVLVSHDFLGANFEQFLLTQDGNGDFRRLLSGVSAIVIGSHVRPSFYTAATGAIYLDANNLWLSAEQRDVVTEVPDYRSAFDDELNFTQVGRLVRNNAYARRSNPASLRGARTVDELILDLGRLLYHELAHASDFLPPAERSLSATLSIYGNIEQRIVARTLPSDQLNTTYPLTSVEMRALGQTLYQGASATAAQKAYTAAQVGAFFAADRASDDYAYSIYGTSSPREDLAMLFEEFMMSYRHNVLYDTGYTNLYKDGMTNDQLLLGWGERGRIAEAAIKPRIKLVLARIAPWIDATAVDRLPAPILLKPGSSWEASVAQSAPGGMAKQSALQVGTDAARASRVREDIKRRAPHGRFQP